MNLAEGSSVGNLLCASIRELQLEHQASEKGIVTISVGAAAMRMTAGSTKEEILRKADEGLYHAKAAGRDCVRTADLGAVDRTSVSRG
jgi:diguanylate cyclase (GGDEF)-like protein